MHKYKWTVFKGTCWGKKSFMFVCLNTNAWLDTPLCKNLTFISIGGTNSVFMFQKLWTGVSVQSSSFPHLAFPAYSTFVFYFFPSLFTALSLYICFLTHPHFVFCSLTALKCNVKPPNRADVICIQNSIPNPHIYPNICLYTYIYIFTHMK